ncbi:Tn3 family transposase [Aureispira anguillae]|uniref:Transposase n=1 Tax=Aureispira anguillae TaxID=2864201 RepID=A0A915YMG3_9BACT|nr:transposase [Aureispira anguillae]
MLHNVADLTTALNQLTREKETVTPEFVRHLSPYVTKHIKRFGLYVLDLDDLPKPIESKKFNVVC